MKKTILFAAVAGLGLVSAAPPGGSPATPSARAPGGYPPCSRTVQDRCIQLHERGVRTAANLAKNQRLGPEQGVATATAATAPAPRTAAPVRLARNEYRRCSRGVRHGCYQRYERG